MTAILGISAFYHDSAAALVIDGDVVAAAQEERFSRGRHDARFPRTAIDYCLREAGLTAERLDYVAFYDKPLLKFDRLLETWLAVAPLGFRSFLTTLPGWLREKLHVPRTIRRGLPGYRRRVIFAEHHESHAASAFYPSPFDEAAVLTVDGVGEWATASFGVGRGSRIELTHELRFPHSPGLLYSAFTYYCGFRVNSGEYKLMGLAPYGEPRFADAIRERLIDLKADGSFRLDLSYFRYHRGLTMTSRRFDRLFGGPPRRPESELTQRHKDVAASIQVVMEDILLRMARHVHAATGQRQLCLAGGVALNAVANGRIAREGPFESLWIQPAAGDAGGALGVALLVWHQMLGQPRTPRWPDAQRGSLLGPAFSENEIQSFLDRVGARYRRFDEDEPLCEAVAALLARRQVVGWFEGRMEFGPRALGHRSILADPRDPAMAAELNRRIKFREPFRPFAPAVLHERAAELFDLGRCGESPYMLRVVPVRTTAAPLPAITHRDGSARVQTVDAARHPRFHRLLHAFARQTGTPALLNTSFNIRGEPLVCTPEDAWRCFAATELDALVLERCLLLREEQPPAALQAAREARTAFPPD